MTGNTNANMLSKYLMHENKQGRPSSHSVQYHIIKLTVSIQSSITVLIMKEMHIYVHNQIVHAPVY